jgi:hypothetical protein
MRAIGMDNGTDRMGLAKVVGTQRLKASQGETQAMWEARES